MLLKTVEPKDARGCLQASTLFGGLDAAALDHVLGAMEWFVVGGGETLLRVGDPGDALYIVVAGRLSVVLHLPGKKEVVVRELGRTFTVGEMALVTGAPRKATVRALRDTQVGRLSRESFDQLVELNPKLAMRLTRVLAGWVDPKHQAARSSLAPSTVAVIPLPGTASLDVVAQLEQQLTGTLLHLDAARVDATFGPGTAHAASGTDKEPALAAWLNEQEALYGLVVYETDADLTSPWTRRCMRQADRVLVVASDSSRADDREVAAALAQIDALGGTAPRELILVRRAGAGDPWGTGEWLKRGRFVRHHHVRDKRPTEWARLGRHLTGTSLGLVLGGGGARGFAHLGVIRALREARIEVDLVGGTSMGAFISAQVACGFDHRTMIEQNKRMWIGLQPLWELTVPVVSLLGGQRAIQGLKEVFGERAIEDLPLDYYCVSTNLTRGEAVVHRTGALGRAVLASFSIPGVAPPVVEGGDLLVDGAVLNILPTDVMRAAESANIVAVDVSPLEDFSVDARHLQSPSPVQFLGDRLNLFRAGRKFPSIMHILERAAMLSSAHISKAERLIEEIRYIDPPVSKFDTFAMKSIAEIEQLGYEAAVKQISTWTKREPTVSQGAM